MCVACFESKMFGYVCSFEYIYINVDNLAHIENFVEKREKREKQKSNF